MLRICCYAYLTAVTCLAYSGCQVANQKMLETTRRVLDILRNVLRRLLADAFYAGFRRRSDHEEPFTAAVVDGRRPRGDAAAVYGCDTRRVKCHIQRFP